MVVDDPAGCGDANTTDTRSHAPPDLARVALDPPAYFADVPGMRCPLILIVLLAVPVGCADVVVDGSSCITWIDGGPAPADVPSSLACEVITPFPDAGIVPPTCTDSNWCGVELKYVCVGEPGEACPSAASARSLYGSCLQLDTMHGEGCGQPLSGACTTRRAWSACGPDTSAVGGCCYYVYIVESTVLS